MSDFITNPGATGETNGDTAPAVGAPEPSTTPEPADSAAEANAMAARLRRSEKQLQQLMTENAAYRKAESDRADAERSDLEKAQAKSSELEAKLAELQTRQVDTQKRIAFRHAVEKLGVANSDDALRLADLSSLEVDGDKVTGVDALVKTFKRERAYLFAPSPQVAAGSGGGNPASGAPGSTTADEWRTMSSADFAARRAANRHR